MVVRFIVLIIMLIVPVLSAQAPTTLNDFFLPGSQPSESGIIETEAGCNCHSNYNVNAEPEFAWIGSMMSNSARDPLFLATMTIANQDAPESGDLCIRCHFPKGWLEGRSTPTDGSSLNEDDRHGIICHSCHKMIKPSGIGVNPYPDDSMYTANTYTADQLYISHMSDTTSFVANGMMIVDSIDYRRGPYDQTQADPPHNYHYSTFHKKSDMCGTCHDVSNPVFEKNGAGKYVPNAFDAPSPSFDPYTMFPVERTFSEWKVSAYNSEEGVYAPQFGGNIDTVRTCQDCHMRDVTGKGAKGGTPVRDDLGYHDFSGGNTFVPGIINQAFPSNTVNQVALDSAVARATYMLTEASSMSLSNSVNGNDHEIEVMITNETGHKLPSGYPEGRRIWINVQAFDIADNLIYESGAYDFGTAVLTHDADAKIYEIKPGISQTLATTLSMTAGPSFHFVLNDTIYKDNRIPPRGFTNTAFDSIQSPPVDYIYADGQYWDETDYIVPGASAKVKVTLYYQTTSKEYIEFLRDENVTDTWGDVMYNLWSTNGMSTPVVMNIDSLLLTPIAGNNEPILAEIGNKTVDENSLLSFSITATDVEDPSPALTTSLLPSGASFTDNNDGTGDFSWTPDFSQSGSYDVTFYATDDSAAVDSEKITITVNNVNQEPILSSIGNQSVNENALLTFSVTATDPDGTVPVLTTTSLPSGANFIDNTNGTGDFSWTPDNSQAGSYEITFYATDEGSAADSETITITVINVNENNLPVLASIGNKSVDESVLLSFSVTATDTEDPSPALTTSTLPSGANFTDNNDGTGDFDWIPDFTQAGEYSVVFYATDDSAAIDSEQITITVNNVNRNPVIDPVDDTTVEPLVLLEISINGTDPDGEALTYSTEPLPSGAILTDFTDGSALLSWTPQENQNGTHLFVMYLTDVNGASDTLSFSVTVLSQSCCFGYRGNIDNDELDIIDIGDLVYFVEYSFGNPQGPAPVCFEEADVDASLALDISDIVYLVAYMFTSGPLPFDCP